MPWDMNDYPSSLKNLDKPIRKKAIDIANALVEDGYEEDRAIPIATSQAEKWYNNASKEEIDKYTKTGKPTVNNQDYFSDPNLMAEPEMVLPHEKGWAVQAKKALKPAKLFTKKDEALKYGKEIARNKGTDLIVYQQDETVETTIHYDKNH